MAVECELCGALCASEKAYAKHLEWHKALAPAREREMAEALERMASEECGTVFPGDLPHVTKDELMAAAKRLREGGE